MTTWYLDDTEIQRSTTHATPEIYLLGGVILCMEDEPQIFQEMEKIRLKNGGCSRCPLKYNFKALETAYSKVDKINTYNTLLNSSKVWRSEIIETMMKFDYKIIVSAVESIFPEKDKIVQKGSDITKFIFGNGLMRYGLMVKGNPNKYKYPRVVSDWPSKGDTSVLNSEFSQAFNQGFDSSGNEYHSGALKNLNFGNTVHYTRMVNDSMMQFTDIVLGATKEFIECAMGKKTASFGSDLFEVFLPKFYGYPGIMQRGLIVSSSNAQLRKELKSALDNVLISQAPQQLICCN